MIRKVYRDYVSMKDDYSEYQVLGSSEYIQRKVIPGIWIGISTARKDLSSSYRKNLALLLQYEW